MIEKVICLMEQKVESYTRLFPKYKREFFIVL